METDIKALYRFEVEFRDDHYSRSVNMKERNMDTERKLSLKVLDSFKQ